MAKKKTNGKDPAVLLYTQDFIVGTLTMTHEQRGKYIMLLCLQHQKEGKLTLNDLKQYLNEEDIIVAEKFPLHSDGYYYNDRMQMEIQNRKIFTESRRNNGSKGGRPKTTILPNGKPNGYPNGKPYENHTGNEDENEIEYDNINEYTSADIKIAIKQLDKLTEYIDDNNIPAAKELLKEIVEDYNSFDNILQICYGEDIAVLNNWRNYFSNTLQFIN